MKRKIKHIIFAFILLILFASFVGSDTVNSKHHLFKIERSKDTNEIFYDLNISSSNKLNSQNPIHIYWIKHTENNKIEPLSWIQKTYAYGVNYLQANENEATFSFVSHSDRIFEIKKDANGTFKVFTISKNKEVIVNRIFIQIDGGSFWFPEISKVELHAQDIKTNQNTIEIINP